MGKKWKVVFGQIYLLHVSLSQMPVNWILNIGTVEKWYMAKVKYETQTV